jgi:hypothetical protein
MFIATALCLHVEREGVGQSWHECPRHLFLGNGRNLTHSAAQCSFCMAALIDVCSTLVIVHTQPPIQSSRGDTHALSSFCDERHESSYLPHIRRKLCRPTAMEAGTVHTHTPLSLIIMAALGRYYTSGLAGGVLLCFAARAQLTKSDH